MAKPGREAREMIAGARDLARLRMTDEDAAAATEMLEVANGLRCMGCGLRIGRGFTFVSFSVREEKPVMKLSACAREECGYAVLCRAGGTYCEMVEYVWLDELGMDAPAAAVVVERNAKLDAKRAAAENGNAT